MTWKCLINVIGAELARQGWDWVSDGTKWRLMLRPVEGIVSELGPVG
jgi:hypothetical protein